MTLPIESEVAIAFRDQLRSARDAAIKDAEDFAEIIFAVERLGSFLRQEIATLHIYKCQIQRLARRSNLAKDIPRQYPDVHIPFHRLYELIMRARNDALHQGAYARHLTNHAIELSIILEDALMSNQDKVRDFMVREPLCCKLWQPLSFIRQQMLTNSFSFLPVRINDVWNLVSDQQLACYLQVDSDLRKRRLAQRLSEAISADDSEDKIEPVLARITEPTAIADVIARDLNDRPILVTRDGEQGELMGILPAFDLL